MKKNATIKIKREKHVKVYSVPTEEGMTLLSALLRIQEKIDGSISFRWNCRTGQCGVCAVLINGSPKLACTERIYSGCHYVVEPILEEEQLQDLVCDLSPAYTQFFSQMKKNTELEQKSAFEKLFLKNRSNRSKDEVQET